MLIYITSVVDNTWLMDKVIWPWRYSETQIYSYPPSQWVRRGCENERGKSINQHAALFLYAITWASSSFWVSLCLLFRAFFSFKPFVFLLSLPYLYSAQHLAAGSSLSYMVERQMDDGKAGQILKRGSSVKNKSEVGGEGRGGFTFILIFSGSGRRLCWTHGVA